MPDLKTIPMEAPPELEEQVISAAKQGDPAALGQIYDAYARRLYGYFFSRVENSADAEDLTAQTFMRVIEALPRYEHRGQFSAWIFQIGRSRALDYFRRSRVRDVSRARLRDDAALNPGAGDPLEHVVQAQAVETLRGLVRGLDEGERELLRLRFVAGLSYVQIGALLERKEDAVRKAVNRLLERLHQQMEANHA